MKYLQQGKPGQCQWKCQWMAYLSYKITVQVRFDGEYKVHILYISVSRLFCNSLDYI